VGWGGGYPTCDGRRVDFRKTIDGRLADERVHPGFQVEVDEVARGFAGREGHAATLSCPARGVAAHVQK
jgi:hypothetical protein